MIVEDKQLSLAIGKKGQNVRLAAKLTGWKIDIKSEEEKRREVEAQLGALEIGDTGGEDAAAAPAEGESAEGERAEAATAEATASAADAEAQLIAGGEDTREADATKPAADATTEEPKQAES